MIDQIFRTEWARVLAHLTGFLGDVDAAEEATQDAFAIAAERWPRDGVPSNPRAWLITTARNHALGRLRRERTLAAKVRLLDPQPTTEPGWCMSPASAPILRPAPRTCASVASARMLCARHSTAPLSSALG